FIGEALRDCDVALLPTVAVEAPPASPRADDIDENNRLMNRLTRYTKPFNYLGLPALTVPCGFGRHGLPTGLQFVARPFDETTLLDIGRFYQTLTHWHTRCPD